MYLYLLYMHNQIKRNYSDECVRQNNDVKAFLP